MRATLLTRPSQGSLSGQYGSNRACAQSISQSMSLRQLVLMTMTMYYDNAIYRATYTISTTIAGCYLEGTRIL